jgi:hypothetical protein
MDAAEILSTEMALGGYIFITTASISEQLHGVPMRKTFFHLLRDL